MPRDRSGSKSGQNPPEANPFTVRQAECKALDAEITRINKRTRQQLSAQEQDWWQDRRKKARDRQFEIRCQ